MARNNTKYMVAAIALSEELNFTRAAQKIQVSQPTLTRTIKELEANLGFPLFERDRKNVKVTDAGRVRREVMEIIDSDLLTLGVARNHHPEKMLDRISFRLHTAILFPQQPKLPAGKPRLWSGKSEQAYATTGRELFRNRSLHDSDSQVFLNEVDSEERIIYFERGLSLQSGLPELLINEPSEPLFT